jgi:hypothetical protein
MVMVHSNRDRSQGVVMIKSCAIGLAILCVLTWQPAALVATDDPPTASLDELLKLYQELKLPLPPKNAKLVRYESGLQPSRYILAILIEPAGEQKEASLLSGILEIKNWKTVQWRTVEPTGAATLGTPAFQPDILLAIQCRALGWNELAADILARSQKDASDPPKKQLVCLAWCYWSGQTMEPMADRKPVLGILKKLRAVDPEQAAQRNADSLIRSLELALAPSSAKPGSVEALIDGLVDATREGSPYENAPEPTPYQKVVRLGFDAVPALLEHLDDARLTRAMHNGIMMDPSKELLVGDFVSDILRKLAGSEPAQEWRTRIVDGSGSRTPLVKGDVLAWWRKAQKVGEEAYLVQYAANPEIERGTQYNPQVSKQNQLEVIGQKYPRNLEKIYRAILDTQPPMESHSIVMAIESSKLPPNEKTRLLVIGASHNNLQHRSSSLRALKQFDRQQFSAILIKTLDGFSGKPTEAYWSCPEVAMTSLVFEADDEGVWHALERLAKKADVGLRLEILRHCGYSKSESARRLEFLAVFIADKEVRDKATNAKLFHGPYAFSHFPKVEVRNGAASLIGGILEIKNQPNEKWQAKDWEDFREQVREGLRQKGIETPGG